MTLECDEIICSTRVVPDLGIPKIKIGMEPSLRVFFLSSEFCNNIQLEIIGLMCIPPLNLDPNKYFFEMKELSEKFGFTELSMGMSSDYMLAVKSNSTYVRIGSSIFGQRS